MEDDQAWVVFMDKLAAATKLGITVQELNRKQQELEMNQRLKDGNIERDS